MRSPRCSTTSSGSSSTKSTQRNGLINKFQGDAALAVFGAPLRIDDPASAALATARALGAELRRLPVDFGIGVSAGPGVRRQHRRGKPLRVHGCRRRRQRGGTVGRPGQGLRRTGAVFGRRRSTAPTRPNGGAGVVRARRCCAAGRNSRRSRHPCARRCPAPETGRPTAHIRPTRCSRVTYIAQRGMQMYDFAHCGVRARCPGAYPQR